MRFSLFGFMSLLVCAGAHTGHDDNPLSAVLDDKGGAFDDNGVHNGTVFDDKGVHNGTVFDDKGRFLSSGLKQDFSSSLALYGLFMAFM
jgi:hypothetical protein